MMKPFTTTLIGSLPRSEELLAVKDKVLKGNTDLDIYEKMLRSETKAAIEMLERVGIDVIVSGELDRDNYMSYVAERVSGIELMTMEDIKIITGDAEKFDESLEQMDAADNSMNSPVCVNRIDTDVNLNGKEVQRMKSVSDKPFKVTLPSPYLLTRSMWLKEKTAGFYENKKDLGQDVVKLLTNEIRRLVKAGAKVIQIDEPILSEVVFTSGTGDTSFY